MRYWPVPSVTDVRDRSMSAGLDASTVTPGRTPPDASRTTLDPKKRVALLQQCNKILHDQAAAVFMWHQFKIYGLSPKVKGFIPTPDERAHLGSVFQQQDASPTTAGGDCTHQARGTGADDDHIVVRHR